jgi:hypothetical protein
VSVISFSTWILRWQCVPALLCYLYSHLYICIMCLYCIDSNCYWCMTRQMFYMLHEVDNLYHICKIQWNIIKRWDEMYSTLSFKLVYCCNTIGDELCFTSVNHTFGAWGYYLPTLVQQVQESQLLPSQVFFHLSTARHYVPDDQHKPVQTQHENRNLYWSHVHTTILF